MSRSPHFPTRRRVLALGGAAALVPLGLRAEGLGRIGGAAFGTGWSVTGPGALAPLRARVEALFAGVDAELSPWRAESALSRFNAAPAGRQEAGPELAGLTARALALAAASGGAFDPTVGPLTARWGFGPITGDNRPDWHGLSAGTGHIEKARAGLTLDLCGIAKGRALDRAADLARAHGGGMLLDLGGELKALGQHPSGRDWRIAVEHPQAGHPPPALLRLPDGMAAATSGLRHQSYVLNGRRYGHIIDPSSGAPAAGDLLSVTVIAADAESADGWATALFAAGAEGPALARRQGIAALFLAGGGTQLRQIRTGAIGDLLL